MPAAAPPILAMLRVDDPVKEVPKETSPAEPAVVATAPARPAPITDHAKSAAKPRLILAALNFMI